MTTPGDSSENPQSGGYEPPPIEQTPGQPGYPAPPSYSPQGGSHPPPPPPPPRPLPPPPSYSRPGDGSPPSPGYRSSSANSLAYWSLVSSGIGFLCGIGSIVGIVLGVIALNRITRTNEGPRGVAIAGIAVGAVGLVVFIVALKQISGSS